MAIWHGSSVRGGNKDHINLRRCRCCRTCLQEIEVKFKSDKKKNKTKGSLEALGMSYLTWLCHGVLGEGR